jgi:vacuolar-type H+-ATPase subunit I/STV1
MNSLPSNVSRIILTTFALIFELAHLGWEHLNGGVAAHHVLNRADLPAISNWWGVLLVPALTWFLVGRIQRRISKQAPYNPGLPPVVLAGFLGSLVYGAALALAFTMNYGAVTYIFLGLFAVSLLLPTYRAEYVLGFVLGMSFTFGAVLPTVIALAVASFSGLLHFLFGAVWRFIRNDRSPRPLSRN